MADNEHEELVDYDDEEVSTDSNSAARIRFPLTAAAAVLERSIELTRSYPYLVASIALILSDLTPYLPIDPLL
jgi:hypothetical protein